MPIYKCMRMILIILIILALLLLAAIRILGLPKFMYLITADNKKIAYDLYEVANPKGWLILTHMMPATKESWQDFASELQKLGYESVAIDLRGHGESDGGPNGYQKFSDAEHQASIKDLEAAWEFLKSRGATPDKTVLIGASIGANLSLQFLAENPEVSGGVLLSPGNYKGIDSATLVKKLNEDQNLVFVASKKDERVSRNNADQNKQYYLSASIKNKYLIIYEGAGHGTELFDLKNEFDLTAAILKFLENGSIN